MLIEKENKTNKQKTPNPFSSSHGSYPTSLCTGCPSIYWMYSALIQAQGRAELSVQETAAVDFKAQIFPPEATLLLFPGWSFCYSAETLSTYIQLSSSPLTIFKKSGIWLGVSILLILSVIKDRSQAHSFKLHRTLLCLYRQVLSQRTQ